MIKNLLDTMIKRLTEEPRKWTPILSALSALGSWLGGVLLAVVGWFMIHTLERIDDSLKNQTYKIEMIVEKFHQNELATEGRLGRVEYEVKFLDTRVDKLERSKQIAMQ